MATTVSTTSSATDTISGVSVPDSKLAREITEIIRDTETELLFNHSSRVYYFGALAGNQRGLTFDAELLYTGAMFHDIGLMPDHSSSTDRFEVDGANAGNWLTRDQAKELLTVPDRSTLKGKRDYVILSLLVGCALRRQELASLDIESIQMREGRWVVADLRGKGGRVRTVAIPVWEWRLRAFQDGGLSSAARQRPRPPFAPARNCSGQKLRRQFSVSRQQYTAQGCCSLV